MDKRSGSNISLDSLELESKKKSKALDNIADTILVPFYENDVLIKVTKGNKKQQKTSKKISKKDVNDEEAKQCRGYLMNKNFQVVKKTSYLEMFRKQFSSNVNEKINKDSNEIRSISPEFGDTERESFGEDYNNNNNNLVTEFYNTEAYNEMYYEQLMNQELEQYQDQSLEDGLCFNDIDNENDYNNLRSISEVSRPRRRRTTVPISQNIQLGGLGPDMENIRPRLERAKSLQRYSEKVRMENRLKLYKKETEAENEKKKAEKENSTKPRGSNDLKSKEQKGMKSSYLVDKTPQDKSASKKNYTKSKSANVNEGGLKNSNRTDDSKNSKEKESKPNRVIDRKLLSAKESLQKYIKTGYETTRKKSSARSQGARSNIKQNTGVSPLEIRFTVNVGGIRPSSALKSLEEKHRAYQEKVKEFANK